MTLTASRIEITPTGSALGAVVTEVDASCSVEPEVILQLKQAWREHYLLIFKNQSFATEEKLILRLREHINQPQFAYRHQWSQGDLLYWDQATAHYRPEFDANATRILKRVSIRGSRPF